MENHVTVSRNADRREGICPKSSGALEVRCRRVDVEVFASRAVEACCWPGDVKVFASRAPEAYCGPGRREV